MADLKKLKRAIPQMGLFADDVIVHCGDMGNFVGSEAAAWWQTLPCNVVLCAGNHEDYAYMRRLEEVKMFGAVGKKTGANIFVPDRGEILRVFDRDIFVYSGAYSADYAYREADTTIFHEELAYPSEAEKAIERVKNKKRVDYIISHDGPLSLTRRITGFELSAHIPEGYYKKLRLSETKLHAGIVLDELYGADISYDYWFFGHHHRDRHIGKLRCLFNDIVIHDIETGEISEIKRNVDS